MSSTPDTVSLIERAEQNLQRQLDWIERHDSRSSILIGISIGMLGYIFSAAPRISTWDTVTYLLMITTIGLLSLSLFFMYYSHYPDTDAPNDSLLFFGTIAALTCDKFLDRYCSESDEGYLRDLCLQAHVNAAIVTKKFKALKKALRCVLASAAPWSASIIWFSHIESLVK